MITQRIAAYRPHVTRTILAGLGVAALGATSCSPTSTPPTAEPQTDRMPRKAQEIDAQTLALFAPLPLNYDSPSNPPTAEKIALGRMLYYEERLSKNHDVSCNTCHLLDQYGVDGMAVSAGDHHQLGSRNSPTVYNAGAFIAQFWDGRAADLEAQAKGPLLNPVEMAMATEDGTVAVLASIPGYVEAFAAAFPDSQPSVSFDNMAKAIGAFERKLVTPGRFDEFLNGSSDALSEQERRGLHTFASTGCVSCHHGATLGGGSFEKLGMIDAWPDVQDVGRLGVTDEQSDKFVFRVPGLRNVAETGPYLHNGGVQDLNVVVSMMGKYQAGVELKDDQIQDIVAFLGALTGTVDAAFIARPTLPANGPETPGPDPS